MSNKNKRILIVEDDATLAASLAAIVGKVGYQVDSFTRPDEALAAVNGQGYAYAFIDCLLPQIPGVDLAKAIRKRFGPDTLPIFMMSGVFTDRQTVKESLRDAQAQQFLKKPFEVDDVINLIGHDEEQETEHSIHRSLYSIYGRTKSSLREKKRLLGALDVVEGYDIPFVLSLLVEIKASGHLNIVTDTNGVCGASLSQGQIFQVDIQDKESYMGRILIDKGFIDADELEAVLKQNSNKRIGERLIEANLISPHAITEVMQEQMNIRLSKLIGPAQFKINFVESDLDSGDVSISVEDFNPYLHNWIASKLSVAWLKNHYTRWSRHQIRLSPLFSKDHPILQLPLPQFGTKLIDSLGKGAPLETVLNEGGMDEDQALRLLHLLVCKGLALFEDVVSHESDQDRVLRLRKLSQSLHNKNNIQIFELMGGRKDMKESQIHQVFADFKKVMGAEPSDKSPQELQRLFFEIKKITDEAYHLFLNKDELKAYENSVAYQATGLKLRAQTAFEEARATLAKAQYQKAYKLLDEVYKTGERFDDFMLYLIWARCGLIEAQPSSNRTKLVKETEMLLYQIPAEERHTALANLVEGLVYKVKGQLLEARKLVEKAVALDKNMIEARRELLTINSLLKSQKPPDLLRGDLKDVVGALFKKK